MLNHGGLGISLSLYRCNQGMEADIVEHMNGECGHVYVNMLVGLARDNAALEVIGRLIETDPSLEVTRDKIFEYMEAMGKASAAASALDQEKALSCYEEAVVVFPHRKRSAHIHVKI